MPDAISEGPGPHATVPSRRLSHARRTARHRRGLLRKSRRARSWRSSASSGSGKSTIARVLAGLYPATSGSFRVRGQGHGSSRGFAASRGDMRWSFRIPSVRSTPSCGSGHALLRSLKLQPPRHQTRDAIVRRGGRGWSRRSGSRPGEEVLRRYRTSSPADSATPGLRPALCVATVADPRRRAGLHARRLDSHRSAERHEGVARQRGRLHPLHHRTTLGQRALRRPIAMIVLYAVGSPKESHS